MGNHWYIPTPAPLSSEDLKRLLLSALHHPWLRAYARCVDQAGERFELRVGRVIVPVWLENPHRIEGAHRWDESYWYVQLIVANTLAHALGVLWFDESDDEPQQGDPNLARLASIEAHFERKEEEFAKIVQGGPIARWAQRTMMKLARNIGAYAKADLQAPLPPADLGVTRHLAS